MCINHIHHIIDYSACDIVSTHTRSLVGSVGYVVDSLFIELFIEIQSRSEISRTVVRNSMLPITDILRDSVVIGYYGYTGIMFISTHCSCS